MPRRRRRVSWIQWKRCGARRRIALCFDFPGHYIDDAAMKSLVSTAFLAITVACFPVGAVPLELGIIAGGGSCFMLGSYLDAKAADLALQGGNGSTLGTSQSFFFPGISAGIYGETPLVSWLDLRVEA